MDGRLLTRAQVQERLSISRTSIYRLLESDESFPRPLRISGRTLRWREAAIAAWIDSREALDDEK